jgi:hypothetical protein
MFSLISGSAGPGCWSVVVVQFGLRRAFKFRNHALSEGFVELPRPLWSLARMFIHKTLISQLRPGQR